MSPQTIGLILGGIIPAVFFAVGNTFIKSSNQSGISIGMFLIFEMIGYAIVICGAFLFSPSFAVNFRSGSHAVLAGIFLGSGTLLVTFALQKYSMTNSQLVPLYNMNTLLAVLIALWVFAEWKHVAVPRLLLGAVLTVIGGVLVAKA